MTLDVKSIAPTMTDARLRALLIERLERLVEQWRVSNRNCIRTRIETALVAGCADALEALVNDETRHAPRQIKADATARDPLTRDPLTREQRDLVEAFRILRRAEHGSDGDLLPILDQLCARLAQKETATP